MVAARMGSLSAVAGLFLLTAYPAFAETPVERCDRRFGELVTLDGRTADASLSVRRVADAALDRLELLMNDTRFLCREAGQTDCIDYERAYRASSEEGIQLHDAYMTFRARRTQMNEYIPFFFRECIDTGIGSLRDKPEDLQWPEDSSEDRKYQLARDMLAAEKGWLNQLKDPLGLEAR